MIIYFDLEISVVFDKEKIDYPWNLEKYSGHKIKSLYLNIYDEISKKFTVIYKTFEPHVQASNFNEFENVLLNYFKNSENVWISYESHFYFDVMRTTFFRYNKLPTHFLLLDRIKFNDFCVPNTLEEKRSALVLKKKIGSDEYTKLIFEIIENYASNKNNKNNLTIDWKTHNKVKHETQINFDKLTKLFNNIKNIENIKNIRRKK